jgi:hypothetical protein
VKVGLIEPPGDHALQRGCGRQWFSYPIRITLSGFSATREGSRAETTCWACSGRAGRDAGSGRAGDGAGRAPGGSGSARRRGSSIPDRGRPTGELTLSYGACLALPSDRPLASTCQNVSTDYRPGPWCVIRDPCVRHAHVPRTACRRAATCRARPACRDRAPQDTAAVQQRLSLCVVEAPRACLMTYRSFRWVATVLARLELGSIATTFFHSAVILALSGGVWLM